MNTRKDKVELKSKKLWKELEDNQQEQFQGSGIGTSPIWRLILVKGALDAR
ncbi:MAG: hypothetical protein ACTS2F_21145 [Thainema sp.]